MDVHVGTVALGELGVAVAPAVVLLAVEFALAIAGDVAESSTDKVLPQVVRQDQLQAWESGEVSVKSGWAKQDWCGFNDVWIPH